MSTPAPAAPPPVLLATGNPDKLGMLRWLLDGLPLRLRPVTPDDLDLSADPDESGATHEAIARAKAAAWSRAAGGILTIASDGGLLVPALGPHWESRHTRRFAGPAADDAERQRRLLELMQPYAGDDRKAAFVESLAVAENGRALASWTAAGAIGHITETLPDTSAAANSDADATAAANSDTAATAAAAPDNGFWVFPLWNFPHYGRTYDRLTQAQRAAVGDHWAALRPLLHNYLTTHWQPPPAAAPEPLI